jgi:alkylation response protein AidB-like acyl-CoA dehydrogenase
MNFALDETQMEVRDLAAELFGRRVDATSVEKVEATDDRFDRELWTGLAESGLLGVGIPEAYGGLGFGAVETALVLEQLGRAVAPVPLVPTLVAAALVTALGSEEQCDAWLGRISDGTAVIAVAAAGSTVGLRRDGGRLVGDVIGVPWAHVADRLLLPVGDSVFLLDPAAAGVVATRAETTAREIAVNLTIDGARAERVGGDDGARWLRLRMCAALAAVQAGVTDAAVRMTADYTSAREQFGKPLSTFQGVALKAADAYLDATAIRATALQAAWSLDQTRVDEPADPTLAVLTAAWWAAEGGQHCVHLTQHLHGGMGADVTYPVHRYFLWGKQIELLLGGASALLAELGDALADRPDAGDALALD